MTLIASSLQTGQVKTVGSFFFTILMTRLRRRPMLIPLHAWVICHLFQRSTLPLRNGRARVIKARGRVYRGYETVSPTKVPKMATEQPQSPIDWSLARLKEDRLAKTILQNSHLSEVQFSSLVIDVLWPTSQPSSADGGQRSRRRQVSKGAFNRSLAQARRNVIKSIYTVFLLAYFGLFDSPKLEPFLRLGDEMKTFLDAKHETGHEGESEAQDAMKALENALENSIGELARMGSFKRQRDVT